MFQRTYPRTTKTATQISPKRTKSRGFQPLFEPANRKYRPTRRGDSLEITRRFAVSSKKGGLESDFRFHCVKTHQYAVFYQETSPFRHGKFQIACQKVSLITILLPQALKILIKYIDFHSKSFKTLFF